MTQRRFIVSLVGLLCIGAVMVLTFVYKIQHPSAIQRHGEFHQHRRHDDVPPSVND